MGIGSTNLWANGCVHSGSNLWATNLAGAYRQGMWSASETTPFVVPSGAMFNFWQWYHFEANYDGGNVKISNDGGATYYDHHPCQEDIRDDVLITTRL